MPSLNWNELGVSELLPTGTVTLLLADVEGSTRLWETQAEQMSAALARLNKTVNDAVDAHDGVRPLEQGEGTASWPPSPGAKLGTSRTSAAHDRVEIAARAVVGAGSTTIEAISPTDGRTYFAATTNPRMIASMSDDCSTAWLASPVMVS